MPFSNEFMKKVEEALQNPSPATRENLLKRFPMEVTVRADGIAYFNPRVTNAVDESVSSPVTHLQFTPLRDEGCVLIWACDSEALGAEEISRSDSQRTFTVNMKAALQNLVSELPEHRKIKYKVATAAVEVDGTPRTVLVMKIKERQSRKVKARAKSSKGQAKATKASPVTSSTAQTDTPASTPTEATGESAS